MCMCMFVHICAWVHPCIYTIMRSWAFLEVRVHLQRVFAGNKSSWSLKSSHKCMNTLTWKKKLWLGWMWGQYIFFFCLLAASRAKDTISGMSRHGLRTLPLLFFPSPPAIFDGSSNKVHIFYSDVVRGNDMIKLFFFPPNLCPVMFRYLPAGVQ